MRGVFYFYTMQSFIKIVLSELNKKKIDLSDCVFILPNKRAGLFLKEAISTTIEKNIFSPDILPIDDFITSLSGLSKISNTELLFEFYSVYKLNTPTHEQNEFEDFIKWARILLNDFDDIDRELADSNAVFNYLQAINDLDHWSLDEDKTSIVENYMSFWKDIKKYYSQLSNHLLNKSKGYQGLIYKEAINNLESYINSNSNKLHIFLGFNALYGSESIIIQELLQSGMAKIYWDIDEATINSEYNSSGYYINQYINSWPYYNGNKIDIMSNNYSTKKNISVIGTAKNIGQAKYIGEIIGKIKNPNALNNTAIVLGDEKLLTPLLNSMPNKIEDLNITMGLPIKLSSTASLFDNLLKLHSENKKSFYYKNVISILSHELIVPLLNTSDGDICKIINTNNIVYPNLKTLIKINKSNREILELLLSAWDNTTNAIDNCIKVIYRIKDHFDNNEAQEKMTFEYLYHFNKLFNKLKLLQNKYEHINSIRTLHNLYREIIKNEKVPFNGEPLKGLQVMGVLESRVLDFETVIISSLNEGILPMGNKSSTFIPFDVRIQHNLPIYKDKDAIYSYHFYRLIQRAKNIYLLYNTEPDVINGGEISRFIRQLEIENIHKVNHKILVPKTPIIKKELIEIDKNSDILKKLNEISERGFTASMLLNYIRNPISFYYQTVLEIPEDKQMEETIAYNTLGSVIHNTLEDLYKPIENKELNEKSIKEMQEKKDKIVDKYFQEKFSIGNLTKGKNLIIVETAKKYIDNFLKKELKDVNEGNIIKILGIETKFETTINLQSELKNIKIRGKIDRIDSVNGITRVIDYKTGGQIKQTDLNIKEYDKIFEDKKYSNIFQLLFYSLAIEKDKKYNFPLENGIISFRNLNAGALKTKFLDKSNLVTPEKLDNYKKGLERLIIEILDIDTSFKEKKIEENRRY
mgnify:FL=1